MATTLLNIERIAEDCGSVREMSVIRPLNTQTAKLRVAAYARVSGDSDDQLNSYISQVRHYNILINENEEWEYVDVYADEGLTGLSAAKRKDFQRMLTDCRRGLIDRILVKSVSRFARNFAECMAVVHELKFLGVSVMFQKENIDTANMTGELILAMQANKAQKESLSIADNMRRGVRMRMKTGTYLSPHAPYGYRLNTQKRTLEIEPEEAKIVRRIYAEYLSGFGMDTITERLNSDKVRKDNETERWYDTTIKYILTNISYTGDMIWQKTYSTDELPFKQVKNNGEKSRWLAQNCHSPIISREDFETVQNLMAERRALHCTDTPPPKHFLAGHVYCGECGTLCRRKVKRGIAYWVCRKHNRSKNDCPTKQIPESDITAAFRRMRKKLCIYTDSILLPMSEQFRLLAERRCRSDIKLSEVNKELCALSEQVLVLERLNAKGYAEPGLYLSKSNELKRQIRSLRVTKRRLTEQATEGSAADATETLIAALNADENDTDAEVFAAIVKRATVTADGKIKFRLINGLELTEYAERGRE
jgi:DNA invertase Pin-like site-specific DNA recombinase